MNPPRLTLDVLQAGRGIAASMVVLFHANLVFAAAKYWNDEVWQGFRMAHAGVEFFFVLSGFIIAYIHMSDAGQPTALPRYAIKRLVRIYPTYWVALLLIVAPLLVSPSLEPGASRAPMDIVASIFLWPTPHSPHLAVAWTLRHELLFYALFATLLIDRRLGLTVLGLWFTACAAWSLAGPPTFPGIFYFSAFNLLFPMGIACAWVVRHRAVPQPFLFATGGVAIFAATGWVEVLTAESRILTVCYGIGSAAAILGLVELERSRNLKVNHILKKLGDASYSIYLIHYLALSLGAKLMFMLGVAQRLPVVLSFVILVAGAIAAGVIFRWLVERPAVDGLNSLLLPRRREAPQR